ncbi:hypothetical protein ACOBQB_00750 [Streptomyces sp. G5(2025)]|uniref:hypothetical protein n=1 Tax=Streptomyces sp. G5(2025) TaxID=3406628 RepID=UPI003C29C82D
MRPLPHAGGAKPPVFPVTAIGDPALPEILAELAAARADDMDADTSTADCPDGRELRVVTLGAGFPELYPAPLRIATWLLSGARLVNDVVGARHRLAGADPRATHGYPRFAAGDVVLSRRRWYAGEDLGKALTAGPGDADRLLALTAWRARHGVPPEVGAEIRGDRLVLTLGARGLTVPATMAPFLAGLLSRDRFRPKGLTPPLDPAQREHLLTRLRSEGVLTPASGIRT